MCLIGPEVQLGSDELKMSKNVKKILEFCYLAKAECRCLLGRVVKELSSMNLVPAVPLIFWNLN